MCRLIYYKNEHEEIVVQEQTDDTRTASASSGEPLCGDIRDAGRSVDPPVAGSHCGRDTGRCGCGDAGCSRPVNVALTEQDLIERLARAALELEELDLLEPLEHTDQVTNIRMAVFLLGNHRLRDRLCGTREIHHPFHFKGALKGCPGCA